jgi:hypothetical protein
MSTPPMPIRHAHKSINLSKFATVFALTFSLAFGLCSVSGISIDGGGNYRAAQLLIAISLVIEAICAAGLVVLGIVAMLRRSKE